VIVPFDGVEVTGGLKVDVPFKVLQLLTVTAAAGDAVRAVAAPAASARANAADANFANGFMYWIPPSRSGA
jgi:hypothetical protein